MPIDHDSLDWARAMLLRGQPPMAAFRIMVEADPQQYGVPMARALLTDVWRSGLDSTVFTEEGIAVASATAPGTPGRTEILLKLYASHQHALFEQGRRAEGMAARAVAGELARTATQHVPRRNGLAQWARGLAEQGRHAEAAELCVEASAAIRLDPVLSGHAMWDEIPRAAQLAAAGRPQEAADVFGAVVSDRRATFPHNRDLVHLLLQQARFLATAGEDPGEAHQEAVDLVRHLAADGETHPSTLHREMWAILAAVSVAGDEMAAGVDPLPAFGWEISEWTPDLRRAYCAGIDDLIAAASRASRPAVLRRRIAARCAVRETWFRKTHDPRTPCAPAFDDSVAAGGPEALIDRAAFAVVRGRYDDALDDLTAALR
ncbi:hypothetical protein [Actinoplanes friuliensis]|nr:hypothetical protein [Actinoplanes friuliensis]